MFTTTCFEKGKPKTFGTAASIDDARKSVKAHKHAHSFVKK